MAVTVAARPTLHYVYDPLCGWCYAAAPLVQAAEALPGLALALHGGGMLAGTGRRTVTPQWRDYVIPHDRRIAALSGQPFGAAYFDGLLRDNRVVLDSVPPTTAVLAAQALAGRGPEMLRRLQRGHYAEGLRITDAPVLGRLAQEIGLDAGAFAEAFAQSEGAPTQRHIDDSRQWLERAGGQGFPTFALERPGTAALEPLNIGPWLGRAGDWQAYLGGLLDA